MPRREEDLKRGAKDENEPHTCTCVAAACATLITPVFSGNVSSSSDHDDVDDDQRKSKEFPCETGGAMKKDQRETL